MSVAPVYLQMTSYRRLEVLCCVAPSEHLSCPLLAEVHFQGQGPERCNGSEGNPCMTTSVTEL